MHRKIGFVLCLLSMVAASRAQAFVSEAYLFSDWTSPTNNTAAPFTFTGTQGVKLSLNAFGLAIGQTSVASPVTVGIEFPFKYRSHTGTLNAGETFSSMAARVNSELGRWDDVGLVQDGPTDAPLNVDFGKGAKLYLKKFDCPLTHIIIAEDAGLDPFGLWWDEDGDFSSGAVALFTGFNNATQSAVLARPDFGADDSGSDIDQAYLFVFDQGGLPPGYLKIMENGNFGGALLEVDFAGGRCIPEPTTSLTVGLGLSGLGVLIRRRR
ncbi:MAG: PEP-CTERM sorting domain-containing protein [Verrucomicrobiae bacterium]|nr:PEP-CTERM sorting domain-containing protein [Verrucomicrobiae bacterium]